MKTVKEFRDLGVEFAAGDKCRDDLGVFTEGWYVYGNIKGDSFDPCKVTHFAWRPIDTLPDNPRFKYELDYSKAEIKWRPLLDQSDSKVGEPTKPVFTQAMADVGELPPVGCEVVVSLKDAGYSVKDADLEYEDKTVTVMSAFKNRYGKDMISVQNDRGACICYTSTCAKPLDTRTPKQKAVDDALSVWPVADKSTLELAYALWVDKC